MKKTEINFKEIKRGVMRIEVYCGENKYTLRHSKRTGNFTLRNKENKIVNTLISESWISLKNKVLYLLRTEETKPTITLVSNIKNK